VMLKPLAEALQNLGRALMLPIAVLPVAALLLRLGQPDLLHLDFVSAAGNAMFAHLGLLFAIGVATGFSRDGNGAAALAGVVCFLVATEGAKSLMVVPPDAVAGWSDAQMARLDVPVGIVSGIIGGRGYNRFSGFRPPEYLAFFGGRRFVPIVSGVAGVILAGIVGLGFAGLDHAIDALSRVALASGVWGMFAYGLLNRLLLVTGLHHILNNIAWFLLGDFHGTTGDLRRFFAGDPSAGGFMSGFFPVMMFGLPAACLAMYHATPPGRRKAAGGMLLSLAATSFLTGVTEPIEFSFMFLAPLLYVLHAVLTGSAMVLMALLGVHLGFGFSAGLFDYVLNFGKAQRPLLLIPVGLGYAAIYYTVFRVAIARFNLRTPGREEETAAPVATTGTRGEAFVAALGGAANLIEVGACTTRLRLVIADQSLVDEAALRGLGAKGVLRPSPQGLQVVLGPVADMVSTEIRGAMQHVPTRTAPPPVETSAVVPEALRTALGNAGTITVGHSRVMVQGSGPLDMTALAQFGLRGSVAVEGGWHLLFAPETIANWR
jgi:N-acetylglucosamine PTS system EIICBA or EIICB component